MYRFCAKIGIREEKDLAPGLDFRLPQYRREVLLRLYEFHLKYRSHAGGVYQFIPYLRNYFGWGIEESLWYATINAFTQYPMTSLAIFNTLPSPKYSPEQFLAFEKWFAENWGALPFDTDRRYQKVLLPKAISVASELSRESGSLEKLYSGDFVELWKLARGKLYSLGRLGAWSGLEFVKIAGKLDFTYSSLFLRDKSGSKSHRNGLCIVLGREDLDWGGILSSFAGDYKREEYDWLEMEGAELLREARERFNGRDFLGDVGYETLETTLCCYKGWHRRNRRYPNVYNDMAYGRLLETASKNPSLDLTPFWKAREKYLPDSLRIECRPEHPQYGKRKLSEVYQNYYLDTGGVHTMGIEWPCFKINPT